MLARRNTCTGMYCTRSKSETWSVMDVLNEKWSYDQIARRLSQKCGRFFERAAKTAFAGLLASVALVAFSPGAVADPYTGPSGQFGLGLPGQSTDGLPNCGTTHPRTLTLNLGIEHPQPPRALDETFAAAPSGADWCNIDLGFGGVTFGPEGITLQTPTAPVGGSAEIVAQPITVPGMAEVFRLRGSNLVADTGAGAWGISNRSADPMAMEVAWFGWKGTTGPVTQLMAKTGISDALTQLMYDAPAATGFNIYVKQAGERKMTTIPLDPALLSADHSYGIRLYADRVEFFVDGNRVATSAKSLTGRSVDIAGRPIPLSGQIWMDTQAWNPFPVAEFSPTANSATLAHYRQGPIDDTPLTLP
ncbi:hypothetical protein [Nocardia sp. NPDC051570]|uniref:hypothetical protein n=1 Tax=Nocardia sp. NPDC051570 TaxID=3364324 RepID=UPI0037BB4299